MPKYMLVLRSDVTADYSDFTPEDFQKIVEDYGAWAAKLVQQGLFHLGQKLVDEGGRVITPDGEGVKVKDGPYVESKEVVGGVYLITADSYDHAVELCQGHPNLKFGTIEVRELDFMGQAEKIELI